MSKRRRPPYERVAYRGVTVDRMTRDALEWVAYRLHARTGESLQLAQGSYNAGKVAASAGTHDGGGVVDIRSSVLSEHGRKECLSLLKQAGFAAWQRPTIAGLWGAHIHAVQIGNKRLSLSAQRQVDSFDAGRDGLSGNRPDDSGRPRPAVRWGYTQGGPVAR